MSTDLVKLGHLFAEIASGHDVSRFGEIVAPDYVNHNAFAEPGLEGVEKVFGGILAGMHPRRLHPGRRRAPAKTTVMTRRIPTADKTRTSPCR